MRYKNVNKKMISLVFYCFLFVGLISPSAYAVCVYEGNNYPTGTRLGDLTCQPDGTWK